MNETIKYPTTHTVIFEHWIDAYENEILEENKNIDSFNTIDDNSDIIQEDNEEYMSHYTEEQIPYFKYPIKTVMTPFGLLPLTEKSLASKQFKFWVGHTNFPLYDSHIHAIGHCYGVETVDRITPYRFRIAVAKLCKDSEVKDGVRQLLINMVGHELKKQNKIS